MVRQRLAIAVALVLGLACLGVPVVALYLRGGIGCPSPRSRPYSVADVRRAFERTGLEPQIAPTPAVRDPELVVLRASVGRARLLASICPWPACRAPGGDALSVPDARARAGTATLNLWIASAGDRGPDARRADALWSVVLAELSPPVPRRCYVG